jgi:hypothetical protein
MDLDQLAPVIELDRVRVGAGHQPMPDQLPGHGIQRSVDLNMPVPGHFGFGIGRDGERRGRGRQQQRGLLSGEHLARPGPGGAVDPGRA